MTDTVDFVIGDYGSIILLLPCSDAGRAWAAEHLPADALRWCAGIVIEPRYAILDGIVAAGLTVSTSYITAADSLTRAFSAQAKVESSE